MKLFEFLEKITEEKFLFQVNYIEWSKCIDVEVDAFCERWVVSFDNDGFVDFRIFREISAPDSDSAEHLQSLFNRPQQAWLDASEDLGIEFISPFKFVAEDGEEHQVTGLLPQFGGTLGTIIITRNDTDEAALASDKLEGYQSAGLSPSHYDQYERNRFIETLTEWGWSSNYGKPEWLNQ